MIRRMVDAAEPEIGLAGGLGVAVQENVLLAAVPGRAEISRLFAADAKGGAVGVGTVLHRYGGIVLLDASFHFREKSRPKSGRIRHQGGLVGVLGVEMRTGVGRKQRRIPEHVLPVVGAHPRIVVDPPDAVMLVLRRLLLRPRRLDGGETCLHSFDLVIATQVAGNEHVRAGCSSVNLI